MSMFHIYIFIYIDMQNNKWLEVKCNDGSFDKNTRLFNKHPLPESKRTQILNDKNKELGGGFNYWTPRNFAEDSHFDEHVLQVGGSTLEPPTRDRFQVSNECPKLHLWCMKI